MCASNEGFMWPVIICFYIEVNVRRGWTILYQCFFYTVVFRFVNCVTFSDEFEVCSFFFHEKKVKRLFWRLYVLKFQIATKIRFALQNSLFIIFLSTSVIKIYLLKIGIYFKVFIKLVIQTSQTRHCENMIKSNLVFIKVCVFTPSH